MLRLFSGPSPRQGHRPVFMDCGTHADPRPAAGRASRAQASRATPSAAAFVVPHLAPACGRRARTLSSRPTAPRLSVAGDQALRRLAVEPLGGNGGELLEAR